MGNAFPSLTPARAGAPRRVARHGQRHASPRTAGKRIGRAARSVHAQRPVSARSASSTVTGWPWRSLPSGSSTMMRSR